MTTVPIPQITVDLPLTTCTERAAAVLDVNSAYARKIVSRILKAMQPGQNLADELAVAFKVADARHLAERITDENRSALNEIGAAYLSTAA